MAVYGSAESKYLFFKLLINKKYRKAEYVQRRVGFSNVQVILCKVLH